MLNFNFLSRFFNSTFDGEHLTRHVELLYCICAHLFSVTDFLFKKSVQCMVNASYTCHLVRPAF